jgi:hypothetical protein
VVLLVVIPFVAYPDLDGLDRVGFLHDRPEVSVVVARSSPDLDRDHDLFPQLRTDRELDETSRPGLHLDHLLSFFSFCSICFFIEERTSYLIRRA